ncbi:uncharacterized protein ACA1_266040 [Acanthamoeba castellanii str. Neff]|uniref:SprT-like domain-containing protein n=1 Tax=Acanthamoeba castellanii (strain ATCC 30010 / Neff) TaxID=1257118 RepID=L8H1I7_ACACF|nr:uncharacterized protein ACA1_266040 [Acanthamoeba castellanii str. Neff]ELR19379.1 hypothetical protein ACA1_266040 [Acanthamoeba castellanii str. Neff]
MWAPWLTKTVGWTICKCMGEQSAAIKLLVKVLTKYKQLCNTLCHKLCHATAWLLDNTFNPPHSLLFFKWYHSSATHHCSDHLPPLCVCSS